MENWVFFGLTCGPLEYRGVKRMSQNYGIPLAKFLNSEFFGEYFDRKHLEAETRRGKMDSKSRYNIRQLFACQCMAYKGKEISKTSPLTLGLWNCLQANLNDPEKTPLCCALPTPDLKPDAKAKMQRTGTYYPSIGNGRNKVESWGEASRIAIEAIGELIEIQSSYDLWRDNSHDAPSTAQLLEEVCDLNFNTAIEIIERAAEITLPKGFGRD